MPILKSEREMPEVEGEHRKQGACNRRAGGGKEAFVEALVGGRENAPQRKERRKRRDGPTNKESSGEKDSLKNKNGGSKALAWGGSLQTRNQNEGHFAGIVKKKKYFAPKGRTDECFYIARSNSDASKVSRIDYS